MPIHIHLPRDLYILQLRSRASLGSNLLVHLVDLGTESLCGLRALQLETIIIGLAIHSKLMYICGSMEL